MPRAVSAWLFPVRSDQVVPHFPVVAMYSLDFLVQRTRLSLCDENGHFCLYVTYELET